MNKILSFLGFQNFIVFSILCSVFIYFIHFVGEKNSMLNLTPFEFNSKTQHYENAYLEEVVTLHKYEISFSKRKVNTIAIEVISQFMGISKSLTFLLLNFVYLVFSGFFLAKVTTLLFQNVKITFFAVCTFYFNFTILFAFFPPLYTFDDILQYLTLFIAAYFILKNNLFGFFISFLLAVFVRESSLFVAPLILCLLFFQEKKSVKAYWYFVSIALIFIVFVIYLFQITDMSLQYQDTAHRGKYLFLNFSTYHRIFESLLSWISIFLIPLILSIISYKKATKHYKYVILIFWGIVIFNSTLMYITCLARETRLFNVPIILFLPFFGKLILEEIQFFKEIVFSLLKSVWFYLYSIGAISLSFYISKYAYQTSVGLTSEMYFHYYFFITLMLFFTILFYRIKTKIN